MKIVSRYITAAYLRMLSLCIGSFIAIYLVIDFLEKIGKFSRAGGEPQVMALFFLYKIPEILNQITPLAVLMATMLTLGVLSRNSEIVAMRGCGISLVRITAPILIAAFFISLFTLFSAELIVPKSFERMKYIEDVLIAKKSPNTFFRQQNIWYREENSTLQARLFDPATRTLKGVTLWRFGAEMSPTTRIEASQGILSSDHWLLKDVAVREFAGGNVVRSATVREMPVYLHLKIDDLRVLGKYTDNMGFLELRRYCEKLEKGGYDATRYRAQMHSKISLPFASLVMAFLGIPFALRGGRTSGIALGIGVSLGIGFGYFMINAVVLSFGQGGVLSPLISAWAANFLFAAVGVWLAMTVNR
ncbi:MAG: YjgP/YjgQ family [Geobacteraceae bacterium]|nr:MAG: YjgP/YjgQ family [Geobacteraceae bacterium]